MCGCEKIYYLLHLLTDTNIDINTDGMLRCAASGKPTPVISWYKSGDFKISGVLSEMNGSNLTITSNTLLFFLFFSFLNY